MKSHRAVLALVADTHGGHVAGLTDPDAKIEDLHTGIPRGPKMTARQEWLWGHYVDDVRAVLAYAGKDPLTVVHMGDAAHGNLRTDDLGEVALHAQLTLAKANAEPWRQARNLVAWWQVAGTSWHDFGDSSAAAQLVKWLRDDWKKVEVRGHFHPLVDVGGELFDLAHHGPGAGGRKGLEGNALRLHVKDRMTLELERGHRVAAAYAYGHVHKRTLEPVGVEWNTQYHEALGIICPPYCLPGAYAHQAAKSPPYAGVGLVALEVIDGKLVRRPFLPYHELDLRGVV